MAEREIVAQSGFINYILDSSGNGGVFLVSEFDPNSAGGVITSFASTLTAVATIFHKPASAFTTGCNNPGPDQMGFGTWGRANGGSVDTENEGSSPIFGPSLRTKNRTDFYGLQAGFDTAFCNINNQDLTIHAGVTGGYVEGTSDQLNGDFKAKFDSYFVGLYGAMSKGMFSAEVQLRYDDHSLDLSHSNPVIIAPGTDTDGETFAGTVSGNYDIALSDTVILSPTLGITVSNTSIDSFEANGGLVAFDDLLSVMGFAGVNVQKQIRLMESNAVIVPYAAATLYNEFAGDAESTFTLKPVSADIETNRIGTFGQVGVGVTALRYSTQAGQPWIYGNLRVDAQIGERIEGWGVTGQVRVQF